MSVAVVLWDFGDTLVDERLKSLGPFGVLLAYLLGKLKFLAIGLKFAWPFLKTGVTMLVSMWVYAKLAGWMFAVGDERAHLLDRFTRSCFAASALDCPIVMSAVDRARGDLRKAADSVRQVGDLATQYGVRMALEFNSQAAQFNSLASVREVLAMADHPACGLESGPACAAGCSWSRCRSPA